MTDVLKKLLDGEVCDVGVEASLRDGSRIVFWCDGVRGGPDPELTGKCAGVFTHLPTSTILSVRVLSRTEFAQLSGPGGTWWHRK